MNKGLKSYLLWLAAAPEDVAELEPHTIREAFVEASATRGHLLVHTLDNVNGRAYSYTPDPNNRWSRRQLELPNNISVNVIDADTRVARVIVPDYQLSLAIGKEGQNARLAARLTGWRIDIRSDAQPDGAAETAPSGTQSSGAADASAR